MTNYEAAANRLHHLSMRYAAAVLELALGRPVGMVPQGYPGLKEFRDLADLILFVRAEMNANTRLMVEAGIITAEQAAIAYTEEYDHLTKAKAEQLGVGVNDAGLIYDLSANPPVAGAPPQAGTKPGTCIVYGTRCLWWDSIDKAGKRNTHSGPMPCCPICKGVLMEMATEAIWWEAVDSQGAGYRDFVEWLRGKCFKDVNIATAAYRVEKGADAKY